MAAPHSQPEQRPRRERRPGLIAFGVFLMLFGIMPAEFPTGAVLSIAMLVGGIVLIAFGWIGWRRKSGTGTADERNVEARQLVVGSQTKGVVGAGDESEKERRQPVGLLVCSNCSASISFDGKACPSCGFVFGRSDRKLPHELIARAAPGGTSDRDG